MKTDNTAQRGTATGRRTTETNSHRQAMRIPVVTQDQADDILASDGPMVSTSGDESPTRRELEQDVMTTNPSIESMDSRG